MACSAQKDHRFLHGFRELDTDQSQEQSLSHSSAHHLDHVNLEDALCSPSTFALSVLTGQSV